MPLAVTLALVVLGACVPTGGIPASGALGVSCAGKPCAASPAVDCTAAEKGLQFAPFMIADFEKGQAEQGHADFMYMYTDDTAVLHTDDASAKSKGYDPPAFREDRCDVADPQNQWVFHVTGGPFLAWGGGIGIAMQHLYQDRTLCPAGASRPDYCPPLPANDPTGAETVNQLALDVSQWDGVALWARRGSQSQPLLRVLVGDKYTDDDLSFQMYQNDPAQQRFCERVRDCACLGTLTCDEYPSTLTSDGTTLPAGSYCGAPGSSAGTDVTMGMGQTTNTCNKTRCNEDYPAFSGGDSQFNNKACTPHAFRNGSQSSFCFNPGDPPPAEPDQQCGDHFTFPLHLTTEWQLYLVPFSSMSQQGWAKKAPYFDLKSVSVVRLTWDVGNIDYYIDNLRFYRVARN